MDGGSRINGFWFSTCSFSGFSTVGVLHQVKLMAIQLSPDRLLLLFSATWPDEADKLVDEAWLPHEPGGPNLSN